MNWPKVSVLVLSYNGKHLLKECLDSYLANDYPAFDLTVIDNGSTDGTKEYVQNEFPMVELLRTEKNLGYSGGFNFGMEHAFGKAGVKYLLITNNDVKADKHIISELVKVAETDDKIGFVSGKVYDYDRPDVFQTVGKQEDPICWNGDHIGNMEQDRGQYDQIEERVFSDDVFILTSRKLYEDVGGYDTEFRFQYEETDWQARAKKVGYKIVYTPHAKLWHKDSATIGKESAFVAYYDTRNLMLVILKHKSPEFFRRYFRWYLRETVIKDSLRRLIKRGQFSIFIGIWRGFISALISGARNRMFTIEHFLARASKG